MDPIALRRRARPLSIRYTQGPSWPGFANCPKHDLYLFIGHSGGASPVCDDREVDLADKSVQEFGAEELRRALEIISDSLRIRTETEFDVLLDRVRELASCDYATCCVKRIDATGRLAASVKSLPGNFPGDWLTRFLDGRRASAMLLPPAGEHGQALVWSDVLVHLPAIDLDLVHRARDHGLVEGITLTVASPGRGVGSLFSFSGRAIEDAARSAALLQYLAPHLHAALLRLTPAGDIALSQREREILDWVRKGKTNWEIAQILGISERTVKFHVQNVMLKLDVSSRTRAVAVAMERGLIDL